MLEYIVVILLWTFTLACNGSETFEDSFRIICESFQIGISLSRCAFENFHADPLKAHLDLAEIHNIQIR